MSLIYRKYMYTALSSKNIFMLNICINHPYFNFPKAKRKQHQQRHGRHQEEDGEAVHRDRDSHSQGYQV